MRNSSVAYTDCLNGLCPSDTTGPPRCSQLNTRPIFPEVLCWGTSITYSQMWSMAAKETSRINQPWGSVLEENRLTDFEAFWTLPPDWFEPINTSGGGWSGVTRLTLGSSNEVFFVKRQQTQRRFTPRFPLGALTYRLEYNVLRRDIPIGKPDWVYFGESSRENLASSVLVTRALPEQFIQLDRLALSNEHTAFNANPGNFQEIGAQLCAMHQHRFRHGALFARHIYINPETCEVRLVDFERSRYCLSATAAARKDLQQFLRRDHGLNEQQLDALLTPYRTHLPSAL
ncbi:MAG TPA: hypothetical protein DIW43_19265 [Spongiibacteraceae bacterium]|nr:hypothetical protein [Spongiibacteraceae bacterium]